MILVFRHIIIIVISIIDGIKDVKFVTVKKIKIKMFYNHCAKAPSRRTSAEPTLT